MQRTLKSKILIPFSILTVISLLFVTIASAKDYGSFNYWYSNADEIGKFQSKTIKVFSNKGTIGMSASTFNGAVSSTFAPWGSVLGISTTAGTDTNNTVAIYGQDRNIANAMNIPLDYIAYTDVINRSNAGTGKYNQTTKNVFEITKAEIYFIWDTSNSPYNTSSFSANKWKAIAAHEGGHASGYRGHDNSSSSLQKALMNVNPSVFYDSWGVSAPQLRDTYHMNNVY